MKRQGGTSVMNDKELKDRAEELLYEVERKKVRVTKGSLAEKKGADDDA